MPLFLMILNIALPFLLQLLSLILKQPATVIGALHGDEKEKLAELAKACLQMADVLKSKGINPAQ